MTRHEQKRAAGRIYAECVGNPGLAAALTGAAEAADTPVQRLARALSPSPARIDADAMAAAQALPPAGIIELVSFIAMLQLLHRLSTFYGHESGLR